MTPNGPPECVPIQRILIATHNAHKTREFREILGPGFEVLSLSEVPHSTPPEENGDTFEANARIKAVAASLEFEGWVLADDSGLEVDDLGGEPGVHSARYSGAAATDASNRVKLLAELAKVEKGDRRARFRCVIAAARVGRVEAVFDGAVEGRILGEERGKEGFGYDPLFVPEGFERTFAELGAEEKHRLSHRGKAAAKVVGWLRDQ